MSNGFRAALGIAVLAVVSRLSVVTFFDLGRDPELFEYEEIARNLAAGRGFTLRHHGTSYSSFGPPPFSLLCGAVYSLLGGSHAAMLAIQAFFAGLTVLAVWSVGSALGSGRAALLAAVLTALHPPLFYADTHKIHPLGLDGLLACAGIALASRLTPDRRALALLTGGLHGLALLERTTFVFLVGIGLLRLLRPRRWGAGASLYLLGLGLVVAPWLVRSQLLHGVPLIATHDGETLWRGNNPEASGGVFASGRPGVPIFDAAPAALQKRIRGAPELEQRRVFFQEALAFIRQRPGDAGLLVLRKLAVFFWFGPQSGHAYPRMFRPAYQSYYAAILLAALVGVAAALSAPGSRSEAWRILCFIASVAFLQSLFYVELRHRWAIEPLILVFTASGCNAAIRWLADRMPRFRASS